MDIGTISHRYAAAFYKYAVKHGKEACVYKETQALSRSYTQYPALNRTVCNPVLPSGEKEKVLLLATGEEVCDEFRHFIRLVLRQKREQFLPIICLIYQQIYRKEKRLLHVDIITAVPIDKETEKQIIRKMEKLTDETVDVYTTVRPEILGGYVIHWDTYRWDASVATRLRQIKKELTDTVKID